MGTTMILMNHRTNKFFHNNNKWSSKMKGEGNHCMPLSEWRPGDMIVQMPKHFLNRCFRNTFSGYHFHFGAFRTGFWERSPELPAPVFQRECRTTHYHLKRDCSDDKSIKYRIWNCQTAPLITLALHCWACWFALRSAIMQLQIAPNVQTILAVTTLKVTSFIYHQIAERRASPVPIALFLESGYMLDS